MLATDRGANRLTSSAVVKVVVSDVNDNPPIFTRLFSAAIDENAQIGDFVIQVFVSLLSASAFVLLFCHRQHEAL